MNIWNISQDVLEIVASFWRRSQFLWISLKFSDHAQSVFSVLLYCILFISNSSTLAISQSLITLLFLNWIYCKKNCCQELWCCKCVIYIWVASEQWHEPNAFCCKHHSLHKIIQHVCFELKEWQIKLVRCTFPNLWWNIVFVGAKIAFQANIETFHQFLASNVSNFCNLIQYSLWWVNIYVILRVISVDNENSNYLPRKYHVRVKTMVFE